MIIFACNNNQKNMQTIVKPLTSIKSGITPGLDTQVLMRTTPLKEWLNVKKLSDRLSGTLKKNASIGFRYQSQLEHEALAQTMGWGFEAIPTSYLTFNDALTEGDCHSITEVGWHVDRLLNIHPFSEDIFELKFINIQDQEGNLLRQGIGIIVKETSIQWIGNGKLVIALLTEYSIKDKDWTPALNPF